MEVERDRLALNRFIRKWAPDQTNDTWYKELIAAYEQTQTAARIEISEGKILDILTAEGVSASAVKDQLHKVRAQMAVQRASEQDILGVIMGEVTKLIGASRLPIPFAATSFMPTRPSPGASSSSSSSSSRNPPPPQQPPEEEAEAPLEQGGQEEEMEEEQEPMVVDDGAVEEGEEEEEEEPAA